VTVRIPALDFHPVVVLPPETVVLDLTQPNPAPGTTPWGVGRYDELRPGMYTTALFEPGRHLHVGVDLGGPVGTAVHAFWAGRVTHAGYNPAAGDYGHVLVNEHQLAPETLLYALFGHLSAPSAARWRPGDAFERGHVLGWLGDHHENGGWPSHVHLQLSWARPTTHDMPGTVHPRDRDDALIRYPDPRAIVGPLW
jgi:murein DD-endopeptidase MepM/ murein hydrolase activator NlpD